MLGVTPRTVERRLTPLPQKRVGSHGPESVYLRTDVLRLAEKMGRPVVEDSAGADLAADSTTLALPDLPPPVAALVAALARSVAQLPPAPAVVAVPLADKLLLSLPEAADLSGIPVAKLRADAKSGALKTIKSIGRGLGKVRRDDLNVYVKKLR
jgi:hypothetical protein